MPLTFKRYLADKAEVPDRKVSFKKMKSGSKAIPTMSMRKPPFDEVISDFETFNYAIGVPDGLLNRSCREFMEDVTTTLENVNRIINNCNTLASDKHCLSYLQNLYELLGEEPSPFFALCLGDKYRPKHVSSKSTFSACRSENEKLPRLHVKRIQDEIIRLQCTYHERVANDLAQFQEDRNVRLVEMTDVSDWLCRQQRILERELKELSEGYCEFEDEDEPAMYKRTNMFMDYLKNSISRTRELSMKLFGVGAPRAKRKSFKVDKNIINKLGLAKITLDLPTAGMMFVSKGKFSLAVDKLSSLFQFCTKVTDVDEEKKTLKTCALLFGNMMSVIENNFEKIHISDETLVPLHKKIAEMCYGIEQGEKGLKEAMIEHTTLVAKYTDLTNKLSTVHVQNKNLEKRIGQMGTAVSAMLFEQQQEETAEAMSPLSADHTPTSSPVSGSGKKREMLPSFSARSLYKIGITLSTPSLVSFEDKTPSLPVSSETIHSSETSALDSPKGKKPQAKSMPKSQQEETHKPYPAVEEKEQSPKPSPVSKKEKTSKRRRSSISSGDSLKSSEPLSAEARKEKRRASWVRKTIDTLKIEETFRQTEENESDILKEIDFYKEAMHHLKFKIAKLTRYAGMLGQEIGDLPEDIKRYFKEADETVKKAEKITLDTSQSELALDQFPQEESLSSESETRLLETVDRSTFKEDEEEHAHDLIAGQLDGADTTPETPAQPSSSFSEVWSETDVFYTKSNSSETIFDWHPQEEHDSITEPKAEAVSFRKSSSHPQEEHDSITEPKAEAVSSRKSSSSEVSYESTDWTEAEEGITQPFAKTTELIQKEQLTEPPSQPIKSTEGEEEVTETKVPVTDGRRKSEERIVSTTSSGTRLSTQKEMANLPLQRDTETTRATKIEPGTATPGTALRRDKEAKRKFETRFSTQKEMANLPLQRDTETTRATKIQHKILIERTVPSPGTSLRAKKLATNRSLKSDTGTQRERKIQYKESEPGTATPGTALRRDKEAKRKFETSKFETKSVADSLKTREETNISDERSEVRTSEYEPSGILSAHDKALPHEQKTETPFKVQIDESFDSADDLKNEKTLPKDYQQTEEKAMKRKKDQRDEILPVETKTPMSQKGKDTSRTVEGKDTGVYVTTDEHKKEGKRESQLDSSQKGDLSADPRPWTTETSLDSDDSSRRSSKVMSSRPSIETAAKAVSQFRTTESDSRTSGKVVTTKKGISRNLRTPLESKDSSREKNKAKSGLSPRMSTEGVSDTSSRSESHGLKSCPSDGLVITNKGISVNTRALLESEDSSLKRLKAESSQSPRITTGTKAAVKQTKETDGKPLSKIGAEDFPETVVRKTAIDGDTEDSKSTAEKRPKKKRKPGFKTVHELKTNRIYIESKNMDEQKRTHSTLSLVSIPDLGYIQKSRAESPDVAPIRSVSFTRPASQKSLANLFSEPSFLYGLEEKYMHITYVNILRQFLSLGLKLSVIYSAHDLPESSEQLKQAHADLSAVVLSSQHNTLKIAHSVKVFFGRVQTVICNTLSGIDTKTVVAAMVKKRQEKAQELNNKAEELQHKHNSLEEQYRSLWFMHLGLCEAVLNKRQNRPYVHLPRARALNETPVSVAEDSLKLPKGIIENNWVLLTEAFQNQKISPKCYNKGQKCLEELETVYNARLPFLVLLILIGQWTSEAAQLAKEQCRRKPRRSDRQLRWKNWKERRTSRLHCRFQYVLTQMNQWKEEKPRIIFRAWFLFNQIFQETGVRLICPQPSDTVVNEVSRSLYIRAARELSKMRTVPSITPENVMDQIYGGKTLASGPGKKPPFVISSDWSLHVDTRQAVAIATRPQGFTMDIPYNIASPPPGPKNLQSRRVKSANKQSSEEQQAPSMQP